MIRIFTISGLDGSGRNTFVKHIGQQVINIHVRSYIDEVKNVAYKMGWTGSMEEADRQLLHDITECWTRYNDGVFENIKKDISELEATGINSILYFVRVKKPEDVHKFKEEYGSKCVTVFIYRKGLKQYNNPADKTILDYEYDVIVNNNRGKTEFRKEALAFINRYVPVKTRGRNTNVVKTRSKIKKKK